MVSKSMDDCLPGYAAFALAKAKTAATLGMSSRAFRDKYMGGETVKLAQGLNMAELAGLAIFPGGVVLRDAASGAVVGN